MSVKIKNISKKLLAITLDTTIIVKGDKRRDSIHLSPKEISRSLTEEEFASREIADLLALKPKSPIKVIT